MLANLQRGCRVARSQFCFLPREETAPAHHFAKAVAHGNEHARLDFRNMPMGLESVCGVRIPGRKH
eukprot:1735928-Alexandrium_andersonii.AAC.1